MDESYVVYKHTVPNGKIYIGITKELPEQRWHNGAGYKDNISFWKDILFYGWSNIIHEILFQGLSKKEAKKKEAELIVEYNTTDENFGYNKVINRDDSIKREKKNVFTNTNLLKARMVEHGDFNFVDCLARIIKVSRGTASAKLNGYSLFDQLEIAIIADHYNLSADDIKEIFVVGVD